MPLIHMTSRMYGIKVKEKIDYYDLDDIRLSFSKGFWSVISNYDGVWDNGRNYRKGETIFTFLDGTIGTYTIMARYTDTVPYTNYMYYIWSNAKVNPEVGKAKIEYEIRHNPEDDYKFTCIKKVNGMIKTTKVVDSENVRAYKVKNKQYKLFNNLIVDWHGMNPESGYPAYSFTIISASNYIKDENGDKKEINDEIVTFSAVHTQDYFSYTITDETNKNTSDLKYGEKPTIEMVKRLNGAQLKSVTFDRESIMRDVYHDHKDVFYNGKHHRAMFLVYDNPSVDYCWMKKVKSIAITYAEPFWFAMTTASGIEYNGRTLEARKLIKSWKADQSVNITLRQVKSRKKTKTNVPFDDIVYDVLSTEQNITVTKYIRKQVIDEHGHKTYQDTQEDLPIVFDLSDAPVTCWNLQFRASGTTWTIYSKCRYIRYGSNSYPTGRSILSFTNGEAMHIEIKDETNKYEVKETIVYTLDNEQVDTLKYKLWTSESNYTIKIEKSVGDEVEPWDTVHYYDAMLKPYEHENFILEFFNVENRWRLTSSSDNLYSDGTNYRSGQIIAEWDFNTIQDLHNITVLTTNDDNDVRLRVVSKGGEKRNTDIDEEIGDDSYPNPELRVIHDPVKGIWELRSTFNNTFMDGVQYRKGELIYSVKDGVIVDEFTILVRHEITTPYVLHLFYIDFKYDVLYKISSLEIRETENGSVLNSWSWTGKDSGEGGDVYILNKDKMKSMYGYIWKRWTDPGPTPSLTDLIFIVYKQSTSSSGYSGAIVRYDYTTHAISTFGTYYFSRYSYIPYEDSPYNPNSKSIRLFIKQSRTNYYTLRNLIYTDNGVAGVTAVRDFNGNELGSMYYEDITTLVCTDYQNIEDLQEYRVVLEKFSIGPTGSKTLVHKTVYPNTPSHGYKVINNFGSKYITVYAGSNHTEIVIVDIESDTCLRINGVSGLNNPTQVTSDVWDYLSASYYPRYSGKAGRPEPDDPPHVDGYSWGLSEPSETDYGAKYVFNTNNFVLLNAVLTVTYRQWTYYQEFDYWSYRDTIYKKGLLAIKYDGSSFTCVESSDTDIMYNAMTKYEHSSVSDGEIWYEFRDDGGGIDGPSKYTYDNECYIIVRTCLRQSSYVDETQNFLICKLDKSSGLFNVERTLQPDHFVMVPMYDSSGSFIDNVKVKIGGSGSYYDTANKEIKVCYMRWSHGFVRLVGDSPTSRKDGILLKCNSNSSGTGYAYYIFMDNPYFDTSIGNFIIRY